MKLYRPHDKFTRILFSITLIFIVFSLVIISKIPPADGYEFSIYDVYPWYFWFFIVTSLFIGQLIIIRNAVLEDWSNSWVFGFVTILITDAILLFLPIVRGYLIYGREDVLTHVGYAKDILNSGHISPSNIYPVEHILATTIHGITNIDLGPLTIVIPAILFLLFVFWYALVILQVFKRRIAMFILPISALPLFGADTIFYAPNMLSFYFVPFALYILLKSKLKMNQIEYMAILSLVIICMLFFHPVTFLYLIVIILLLYVLYAIEEVVPNNFYKGKKSYHHFSIKSGIIFLLGLIAVSYIVYSSNPVLKSGLKQLLSNFFGLNPLLAYYEGILHNYDISIVDITKVLICKFGTLFILAVSSTVLILYYLTKYFRKENSTKEKIKRLFLSRHRYLTFFIAGFAFFSMWGLANMFIHFLYFHRVFKFIILFSVPLTGFLFYRVYMSNRNYKKAKFIFIGVLFLLTCISIIGLFPSHLMSEVNYQVSRGEYAGMCWFFEHRDTNLLIYEQGPSQFRFHDAIYGTTDTAHRKNILRSSATRIPDHFGYHNNIGLAGQLYDENTYFIINTVGKFFYENMYPQYQEYWRFVPSDYKKFENSDISANKIYVDGELETYFIIGSNPKIG